MELSNNSEQNTLEDINSSINKVTDESLASTERMLKLFQETTDSGSKTLVNLDEQREKLGGIGNDLSSIKANMKTAEKHIKTIERIKNSCFCGLFPKFWKETKEDLTRSKNKTKGTKKKVNKQDQNDFEFQRITNCAKEDQMAKNMEVVFGEIRTIKNMAIDIGNEVDRSNIIINDLTQKTEENKDR